MNESIIHIPIEASGMGIVWHNIIDTGCLIGALIFLFYVSNYIKNKIKTIINEFKDVKENQQAYFQETNMRILSGFKDVKDNIDNVMESLAHLESHLDCGTMRSKSKSGIKGVMDLIDKLIDGLDKTDIPEDLKRSIINIHRKKKAKYDTGSMSVADMILRGSSGRNSFSKDSSVLDSMMKDSEDLGFSIHKVSGPEGLKDILHEMVSDIIKKREEGQKSDTAEKKATDEKVVKEGSETSSDEDVNSLRDTMKIYKEKLEKESAKVSEENKVIDDLIAEDTVPNNE